MTRRGFMLMTTAICASFTSKLVSACSIDSIKDAGVKGKVIDPEGTVAKRLGFVSNFEEAKDPKHKEGNRCGKCKFFNVAKKDGDFAPCSFASNQFVPNCGWCKQFNLDPKKA